MNLAALVKLSSLACLLASLGAAGCAAEQKVLRTPQYALTHPDYWKVKATATRPGEPTVLSIGRFSSTVMDQGEGTESMYEKSEAEIDVRIFAWPAPADDTEPSVKVGQLLWEDPDLKIGKHGRITDSVRECGSEFMKKFTIFQSQQMPLDLLMQPGFRTIVIGAKAQGTLYGVVARVPFEQDVGLFCHNRKNLQLQLQNVLDGLTPTAGPPTSQAGTGRKDMAGFTR